MPKERDDEAKQSRCEIWRLTDYLFSEKSLEFSFLTPSAPSNFVILEERKKYAGGSVWRCSGCRGTFDHTGVPTYCALCWKTASEVKRLESDEQTH